MPEAFSKDNISPEEKLLRLIKKERGETASPDKKTDPSPAALATVLRPEKATGQSVSRKFPSLSLQRLVTTALLISCLYLVFSLRYPYYGPKKIKLPQAPERNSAWVKKETLKDLRPFDFYLNGIKNRQLFSRPPAQEAKPPTSNIEADSIKDVSLKGVIFDNQPQAIIEDKKEHKIYYLGKGQFVGNFQIEDIQEGKVILSRGEERFELHL